MELLLLRAAIPPPPRDRARCRRGCGVGSGSALLSLPHRHPLLPPGLPPTGWALPQRPPSGAGGGRSRQGWRRPASPRWHLHPTAAGWTGHRRVPGPLSPSSSSQAAISVRRHSFRVRGVSASRRPVPTPPTATATTALAAAPYQRPGALPGPPGGTAPASGPLGLLQDGSQQCRGIPKESPQIPNLLLLLI